MQRFVCDCGNVLFFESSRCLQCGEEVGYDPDAQKMVVIRPGGWGQRCGNGVQYGICNWVVPANGAAAEKAALCFSCSLNRKIPNLKEERNVRLWGRMEGAKRRLVYSLLRMGIPLASKVMDAQSGLAFDIVSAQAQPGVTMGHLNGVITVNLDEADDTYRQINREQLGESTRTLLGHFRHEIGHYFWQRWMSEAAWDDPQRLAFRERFGDEWRDYGAALSWHYQFGAPQDWADQFISGYAASHPWEDWAETWAHYLQILEGSETFEGLGLETKRIALPVVNFPVEAGQLPNSLPQDEKADKAFVTWLQGWVSLSTVLNETSLSLGQPAVYPFVISTKVAQKLRLVDHLAKVWAAGK
ncbi:hypothetical protein FEM03_21440 [Phragmitibacter flavus]|uniref:Zinc-ribbon domain-containing protein n=1 Tax=Phragmitibacter flavus TaxID=2576071 RepID=A0A5R8K8W2_9BACT|nr:putative zinc-binding metallopeptidase [Phragmitibacter flavus]TLD68746.1 hypothetical protein FEM03_21440 [Phragmitibacter flavus]